MNTCSRVTVRDLPTERKCTRLFHQLVFTTEACPVCLGRLRYTPSYAWCRACRKKIRVKSGTWLKGSNLSFQHLWLLVVSWQSKQSPGAVKTLLGLSYPTTRRWYQRFQHHLPSDIAQLAGAVEVDESFFGRRAFGHQTIVAGAKARGGSLRLAVIQDRGSFSLTPFLLRTVQPGNLLLTDAHLGYAEAEQYYARESCNHHKGEYHATAGIENIWSRCKVQMKRQYGRCLPFYLKGWLTEWQARANHPHLFTHPETYLISTLFRIR